MKRHNLLSALLAGVAPTERSGSGVDDCAQRLIRKAAHCAPSPLAERLEEEWLADLAGRRGSIARLRLAFGCIWATRVIAWEHASARVLAAGPESGSTATSRSAQPAFAFLTRRTPTVILIVGLHVLVIGGLAAGFVPHQQLQLPTTSADFIPDRRTPAVPPPAVQPHFVPPPVEIPQPDYDFPAPRDPNAISNPPADPIEGPVPTPPAPVLRVVGGPGAGFPNTQDYYPSAARRLNEKGVAIIRACVDPLGRLTGDPVITQSSGSVRLDEGARSLARAGSGRYRATTEDGKPVSSCFQFRIRFELSN